MQGGECIRLDPNDQDPINVTGSDCSQMSVPRQTAFPVRSSNVRESEGERISVRARPKKSLRHHRATFVPNSKPAVGLSLKFAVLVFLPSTRRTHCPDSAVHIRSDGRSELFRIA